MSEKQTPEQLAADHDLIEAETGDKGYAILNETSLAALLRIAGNSLAEQAEEEAAAGDPAPMPEGVALDKLGGYCPVQGYGTVDGLPFYFRARHEHCSFEVCNNPALTMEDDYMAWTTDWYYEEESDGNAGWTTKKAAHDFIIRAIAAYRSRGDGR